ncbi:hypothetical protein [[Mycoplasma] testudinis]|uniref:hypothetical protein n=1 Tax=[Mycoplasma] testudinis TaxID=33924 RepID=UPI0004888B57|nr:hypothetical protein [[Mycoplasma] testudinis]
MSERLAIETLLRSYYTSRGVLALEIEQKIDFFRWLIRVALERTQILVNRIRMAETTIGLVDPINHEPRIREFGGDDYEIEPAIATIKGAEALKTLFVIDLIDSLISNQNLYEMDLQTLERYINLFSSTNDLMADVNDFDHHLIWQPNLHENGHNPIHTFGQFVKLINYSGGKRFTKALSTFIKYRRENN